MFTTEITAYVAPYERNIETVRKALEITAEDVAHWFGGAVVSLTRITAGEITRIGREWTAEVVIERIACADCGADADEPCGADCLGGVQ